MRRIYEKKKFQPAALRVIEQSNAICEEYRAQGFNLTLRQLYYQHVARGLLPNKQSEYKRLGSILNDARMAGEMGWDMLIDRTRNLVSQPHWHTPASMVKQAAEQFQMDLWLPQHQRVEVWIEKDAAIGVIEAVCADNDVPYFSCRGYTSVSEVWAAAQRIHEYLANGEQVTILHVGDHDPSGLDMTRDIDDRLRKFIVRDWRADRMTDISGSLTVGDIKAHMRQQMVHEGAHFRNDGSPWRVKRIALNYDQVQRYNPPPNPAKTTDSRFWKYCDETGLNESWELDTLDPNVLQDLIQDEIDALRDEEQWSVTVRQQEKHRDLMVKAASRWHDIATMLEREAV